MREIQYDMAINEATLLAMEEDPSLLILGCGTSDPKGIFNTTLEATRRFGKNRVMDVPLSENSILGIALGASLAGMHPVVVHARVEFLMLCMDQIVNHIAKWSYMTGGIIPVSLTIRAIVGRGWGQAAQHSQSLQALFCHIPGLKVIMPSQPDDVKGLLITALKERKPVIYIEHRWLHAKRGLVPEGSYTIPLGVGRIMREGRHVTLVAISYMVWEAIEAAKVLALEGIEVEIIDPRTISPLDENLILNSVRKTGRLLIADTGWARCGLSSEIIALVSEKLLVPLKSPPRRITLPEYPTPCSLALENAYYPTASSIVETVKEMLTGKQKQPLKTPSKGMEEDKPFQGPF